MSAGADENHHLVLAFAIKAIDQEEIAANMAFPVVGPVAFQWVVQSLRPQGLVVGDQEQHDLFELLHVVAAGTRQPLPIL